MTTQDIFLGVLHRYFIEKFNGSQSWSTIILEGMRVLAAHIQDTLDNRRAYSSDNRSNPDAVFWPDPTDSKRARNPFDEVPWAKTYNFIDKLTPIGSAGSCFAMEIAHRLQTHGYNYLITERRETLRSDPPQQLVKASAAWGIIFNVRAL